MLPGIASMGFVDGGVSGAFDVAQSTTFLSRTASTSGPSKTLTTGTVTLTPSGGSGSYSYAWTRASGAAAITATAPSSATTAFSASVPADAEYESSFVCHVTDTVTGASKDIFIDVDLYLIGP